MIGSIVIPSPVGPLRLAADETALREVAFAQSHEVESQHAAAKTANRILNETRRQLDEYFAGARRRFDLPLGPQGTPFQRAVWRELERIPYGETVSYAEIARRLGRPTATRAVGAANGCNPIAIVVPCHRVIGADGSLTGFGGGLPRKRFLLELEYGSGTGDLFAARAGGVG